MLCPVICGWDSTCHTIRITASSRIRAVHRLATAPPAPLSSASRRMAEMPEPSSRPTASICTVLRWNRPLRSAISTTARNSTTCTVSTRVPDVNADSR